MKCCEQMSNSIDCICAPAAGKQCLKKQYSVRNADYVTDISIYLSEPHLLMLVDDKYSFASKHWASTMRKNRLFSILMADQCLRPHYFMMSAPLFTILLHCVHRGSLPVLPAAHDMFNVNFNVSFPLQYLWLDSLTVTLRYSMASKHGTES